ncbi:MAG: hypothetical protein WA555_13565 [Candidatus Sulfotelmatobacter sp.]
MTKLATKNAFFHVIDSHRWLAASGCAWNLVGPGGLQKGAYDKQLPNIDVMIRDCILLHARSLIKFYTNNGQNSDILLRDFDPNLTQWDSDQDLREYAKAIELHLLHLTAYRDDSFRANYPTKQNLPTARLDWDVRAVPLIEKLHNCLKSVPVAVGGQWANAFTRLYDASIERYQNGSSQWPRELRELRELLEVDNYLQGLGIT